MLKTIKVLEVQPTAQPATQSRKTRKKTRFNHRLFYQHGYMQEEIEALKGEPKT